MLRAAATAAALALLAAPTASADFHSSAKPLSGSVKSQLKSRGFWRPGCPVGLNDLRMLTVSHRGFDRRTHTGQLVVNKAAAGKLSNVFRQLYRLHFPIRHMRFSDVYGPAGKRPKDGDVSGSFECRPAVPSPCTSSARASANWSNHAYGLAVDLNPHENPYVGCGATYHADGKKFIDRSKHRPGMVTGRVVKAFASVGWGWGGSWSGNTKDYMHFSHNGH
jgi:hypothetical protein